VSIEKSCGARIDRGSEEARGRVSRGVAKLYPKARISLDFETVWQCLAATILSAQSTDVGVNLVTPATIQRVSRRARDGGGGSPTRRELIVRTDLSAENAIADGRSA